VGERVGDREPGDAGADDQDALDRPLDSARDLGLPAVVARCHPASVLAGVGKNT